MIDGSRECWGFDLVEITLFIEPFINPEKWLLILEIKIEIDLLPDEYIWGLGFKKKGSAVIRGNTT